MRRSTVDDDIERLIEAMDPDPTVRESIRAQLRRQVGVDTGYVRLDDGRIVPEGERVET
jgi:hypothetical protein